MNVAENKMSMEKELLNGFAFNGMELKEKEIINNVYEL